MAMITYDNKSTLNEQPSVANVNKVTSGDMNEIKQVVNTNYGEVGDITNLHTTNKTSVVNAINELKDAEIYSTNEVKTNKTWIDGRPIYRKCINVGTISSIGNYTFNHNIQNIARYTSISAIGNSGNTYYNVPFASNQGMFSGVGFGIRSASLTQIQIYAGATGHSFVAIIEYTKTTN